LIYQTLPEFKITFAFGFVSSKTQYKWTLTFFQEICGIDVYVFKLT